MIEKFKKWFKAAGWSKLGWLAVAGGLFFIGKTCLATAALAIFCYINVNVFVYILFCQINLHI